MYKIKILIIAADKNFHLSIIEHLKNYDVFEIIETAYNVPRGLEIIYNNELDILIMDIMLPIFNGLFVLEYLQTIDKRPACIVFSSLIDESLKKRVLDLGANYFLYHPLHTHNLFKYIISCINNKNINISLITQDKITQSESYASFILKNIGIQSSVKGYYYLKSAIILCIEDKERMESITKTLYPYIAKMYDTTSCNVERSIRYAIKISIKSASFTIIKENFFENKSKVTSGQIIKFLVEQYHMLYRTENQ